MRNRIAVGALAAVMGCAVPAAAQDADKFFAGKQIELVIGTTPGGDYDTYARLVARHMGNYIPGKPSLIAKNMPGAGSNKATGYIYSVAPKDGTSIGAVFPGSIVEPLLGASAQVQHDSISAAPTTRSSSASAGPTRRCKSSRMPSPRR